ncbi:hypothetical protein N836_10790 [Leptolyngbya sp. Heron Island J]|nr:hypothetical protein N836_10790 [Leptolyngbya sp. Heron Island J]
MKPPRTLGMILASVASNERSIQPVVLNVLVFGQTQLVKLRIIAERLMLQNLLAIAG